MKVFSKKLSETPICLNKNIGDLTMLNRLMKFLGLSKKPEASSHTPIPEVVEEAVQEGQPEKLVEPEPKKTTRVTKPAAIKSTRTKKATNSKS
jgi:hypothetical protein